MRRSILAAYLILTACFAQAQVDIDNTSLSRLLDKGVAIIDIRTQGEWEETGIIAGSKLLTFFDEKGKANPPLWMNKAKIATKPGEPVIVICRSGNRTQLVSKFLAQQGFHSAVYNVKDGLKGWVKERGPVVPATDSIAACRSTKMC